MTEKKVASSYIAHVGAKRRRIRGFFRKNSGRHIIAFLMIFLIIVVIINMLLDNGNQYGPLFMKHISMAATLPLPRETLETACCYCCHPNECMVNLNGDFVGDFEEDTHSDHQSCISSFDVIRTIMERMDKGLSFAWVRWGDGEMSESVKKDDYSEKLKRSLYFLSRNDYSIVNVGMWWLKKENLVRLWNSVVPPQPKAHTETHYGAGRKNEPSIEQKRMIFHNSFYLPVGGPLDALSIHKGIKGWSYYSDKYNVVLVGPPHLRSVPFLDPVHFIESIGINRNLEKTAKVIDSCMQIMNEQKLGKESKPLMFLFAAGFSTKIIIAELLQYKEKSSNQHTQIFIDTGASLDGYVGVQSRDYNTSKRYCAEVIKNDDPKNRYHWMKKGVCEEKFWKEYDFVSSV